MMKKRNRHRFWSAAAALILTLQAAGRFPVTPYRVQAAGYSGAQVANQGSGEGAAVIRGSSAGIVHDSTLDSDVLLLNGNSFGAGWLQLPAMLNESCKNGFTFTMRYQLAEDAGNYTRLYQFATVPLGTGSTNGYSSPDLSIDLNDRSNFRASVFSGKGSTTENDNAHRSIFTLSEGPDTNQKGSHQTRLPESRRQRHGGSTVGVLSRQARRRLLHPRRHRTSDFFIT